MNACQTVIQYIRRSIPVLPENFSDRHLPDLLLDRNVEPPPLSAFLRPPPDVLEQEHPDEPFYGWDKSVTCLGYYRLMGRPGRIVLMQDNLLHFFLRLTLEIDQYLSGWRWQQADFDSLVEWVVNKTYWHERFHHSMDVLRYVGNVRRFDRLQEEALAVAYSHYYLNQKYRAYRRPIHNQSVLWAAFLHLAYQYTSPGYRDWRLFADEPGVKKGCW